MNVNKLLNSGIEAIKQIAQKSSPSSKVASEAIQNGDEKLMLTLDTLAKHNLIGKKIGILSKKGIMNSCLDVGDALIEAAKAQDGKLNAQDIETAIRKVFPNLKNMTISQNYEVYRKFMQELGYDEATISMIANSSLGLAITNPKTKQTLLRIGNINGLKPDNVVNLSTHELQHALYRTYSPTSKIANVETKVRPRYTKKMMEKAPKLNQHQMKMQQELLRLLGYRSNAIEGTFEDITADRDGLIKFLNMTSFEELQEKLRTIIRSTIILPNNDKDNLLFLKTAKAALLDEARSYKIGGANAIKYLNLQQGCNISEIYAKLYEETIGVLNEEIRLEKANRLKRLFKMQQIDYYVEPPKSPIISYFEERIKDVKPKKIKDLMKKIDEMA